MSDYTAFLHLGKLVEYGNTDTLFTNPAVKQTEDYITGALRLGAVVHVVEFAEHHLSTCSLKHELKAVAERPMIDKDSLTHHISAAIQRRTGGGA